MLSSDTNEDVLKTEKHKCMRDVIKGLSWWMCNLCCFIGVVDDGPPPLVASEDLPNNVGKFWTLQKM
jgi:hypothetical protein